MFKPDFDEFIANLNIIMTTHYKLSPEDNVQPDNKIRDIKFFDMLKPAYSDEGDLLGFSIRPDMCPIVFKDDDYKFKRLNKAIKKCIMINKLIKLNFELPEREVVYVEQKKKDTSPMTPSVKHSNTHLALPTVSEKRESKVVSEMKSISQKSVGESSSHSLESNEL